MRCRWTLLCYLVLIYRSVGFAQSSSTGCSKDLQISLEENYEPGPLDYHISNPNSVKAAWIEVWDLPQLLRREQVPIVTAGELEWADPIKTFSNTPERLYLGIYDPEISIKLDYFGDGPSAPQKPLPPDHSVFRALVGYDRDADYPRLQLGSQELQLEEGSGDTELTFEADDVLPDSRVLLVQREARKPRDGPLEPSQWHVVDSLPISPVDLRHFKLRIPASTLAKPGVLALFGCDLECEAIPGAPDELDYGPSDGVTITVTGRSRPVLDSIEPDAVDFSVIEEGVRLSLHGSNFSRETRVIVDGGRAVTPEFISETELNANIPPGYFAPNTRISVEDDEVHASEKKTVGYKSAEQGEPETAEGTGTQPPASAGTKDDKSHREIQWPYVSSVSPYPIELMTSQDATEEPVIVYGQNFRSDIIVTAQIAKYLYESEAIKLRTEYVSPIELRVWLPRDLWRHHIASLRLIVQTASGRCATEVTEDVDIDWTNHLGSGFH